MGRGSKFNQNILVSSVALVAGLLIGLFSAYFYGLHKEKRMQTSLIGYIDKLQRTERVMVEKYPIYEDEISPADEAKLRRHLLMDHLAVANRASLPSVQDDAMLDLMLKENKFVMLENTTDAPYFFYNVPKKYRALTPTAKEGVELIAERFQKNLNRHGEFPVVKLALSSVVRPRNYQEGLKKRNMNASFESSHSYGISFDIFYDKFFVAVPADEMNGLVEQELSDKLRRSYGYLMGDALMRQFRAALARTLIELQDEGKIYAILEKNQRCYHVTILH